MNTFKRYYEEVSKRLQMIGDEDGELIEAAADLLFDCEVKGGTIYAFGTGHSHMIAQDLYGRAGGYAKVIPIVQVELTLLTHPTKSTIIERIPEYADVLENLYKIKENDVIIMCSNSGRNGLVVEYAMRCKAKGAKIIAVTSLTHSNAVASRHPSGLRLFEIADLVLDNRAPLGDATLQHDANTATGPVSTQLSCFLVQSLMSVYIQKRIDNGLDPLVFRSSNADNADDYNRVLFKKYMGVEI